MIPIQTELVVTSWDESNGWIKEGHDVYVRNDGRVRVLRSFAPLWFIQHAPDPPMRYQEWVLGLEESPYPQVLMRYGDQNHPRRNCHSCAYTHGCTELTQEGPVREWWFSLTGTYRGMPAHTAFGCPGWAPR